MIINVKELDRQIYRKEIHTEIIVVIIEKSFKALVEIGVSEETKHSGPEAGGWLWEHYQSARFKTSSLQNGEK